MTQSERTKKIIILKTVSAAAFLPGTPGGALLDQSRATPTEPTKDRKSKIMKRKKSKGANAENAFMLKSVCKVSLLAEATEAGVCSNETNRQPGGASTQSYLD